MPITKPPETYKDQDIRVNFFRPRKGFMRTEVTIIWFALAAWALIALGFPIYLAFTQTDPEAYGINGITFYGKPIHYWVSGQLLILTFILICFVFNTLIDWLTAKYRKRR